jgi:hypothetical protein
MANVAARKASERQVDQFSAWERVTRQGLNLPRRGS